MDHNTPAARQDPARRGSETLREAHEGLKQALRDMEKNLVQAFAEFAVDREPASEAERELARIKASALVESHAKIRLVRLTSQRFHA